MEERSLTRGRMTCTLVRENPVPIHRVNAHVFENLKSDWLEDSLITSCYMVYGGFSLSRSHFVPTMLLQYWLQVLANSNIFIQNGLETLQSKIYKLLERYWDFLLTK